MQHDKYEEYEVDEWGRIGLLAMGAMVIGAIGYAIGSKTNTIFGSWGMGFMFVAVAALAFVLFFVELDGEEESPKPPKREVPNRNLKRPRQKVESKFTQPVRASGVQQETAVVKEVSVRDVKRPFVDAPEPVFEEAVSGNANWLKDLVIEESRPKTWLDMATRQGKKHPFILGRSDDGQPAYIDFKKAPHMLVGGQTGYGKTTSFIRPSVSFAAASGMFQVIIIDPSGRNFRMLSDHHHNIHILKCEYEQYPTVLEGVFSEIRRRDNWLASLDGYITEMNDVPASKRPPKILVVVDEYSNAYEDVPEIASATKKIVREGRAMGVHLMAVAQRLTADGIATTARSQMKMVTFCVNPNEERYALKGAASLDLGQALLSWQSELGVVKCLHPTIPMLIDYLKNNNDVPDYGLPLWLPSEVRDLLVSGKKKTVSRHVSSHDIPPHDPVLPSIQGVLVESPNTGGNTTVSVALNTVSMLMPEQFNGRLDLHEFDSIVDAVVAGDSSNSIAKGVRRSRNLVYQAISYVKQNLPKGGA